jgi:hypothetical protein
MRFPHRGERARWHGAGREESTMYEVRVWMSSRLVASRVGADVIALYEYGFKIRELYRTALHPQASDLCITLRHAV